MKNAQKPDHVSLGTLISRLKEGRYVVPDFQREFEWAPWDINDLVRSIFLDYYIGSLLLWKASPANLDSLKSENLFGFSGSAHPDYIILDGQQRLSAIHYAFVAPNVPPPNRASPAIYYVAIDRFIAEEYDKAFQYQWSPKWFLKLLEDRSALYREHIFPCSLLGASTFALGNWLHGYVEHWNDEAERLRASGDPAAQDAENHAMNAADFNKHVETLYGEYQVSYIELDKDLEIDRVCDIFTKLNSTGVRLDIFDLLNALLRPRDIYLKEMYREVEARLSFPGSDRMNVYALQVMSILEQEYCSPSYIYYLIPHQPKRIRKPDGSRDNIVLINSREAFLASWERAISAIEQSIHMLRHPQEFGAVTKQYLPYVAILPAFAAIQAYIKRLPAQQQFSAQRKARRWYWASVFLQRYSDAVESTSTRDFIELKQWFADDVAEPDFIGEFRSKAGALKLQDEQKRATSIYKGIFNLLVIGGARDWMTGNIPRHDELDDHHIVPASWRPDANARPALNSILNRTPLSAETNRVIIRDRLPNAYLPEMEAQIGADAVRSVMKSHLISPEAYQILLRDPFTLADFDQFIVERERTILRAIEHLLADDKLELSPDLRAMDSKIEQIELRLRALLDASAGGREQEIPSHLMVKANDRMRDARRKSPSFDDGHYSTLAGKLEFFDLRDIEAALCSKTIWPSVSERLGSTGVLTQRFGQLAELRNSLRHSRSVNEIARKDGEAAILWFDQALAKLV